MLFSFCYYLLSGEEWTKCNSLSKCYGYLKSNKNLNFRFMNPKKSKLFKLNFNYYELQVTIRLKRKKNGACLNITKYVVLKNALPYISVCRLLRSIQMAIILHTSLTAFPINYGFIFMQHSRIIFSEWLMSVRGLLSKFFRFK